jgi:hypothetical protein
MKRILLGTLALLALGGSGLRAPSLQGQEPAAQVANSPKQPANIPPSLPPSQVPAPVEVQPVKLGPTINRPAAPDEAKGDATSPDGIQSSADSQPAGTVEPTKPRGEPSLPPEAHPWGRFPIGSWKLVRVTNQLMDAEGKPLNTSVTETKTTLIEANDFEYTLQVEVTIQIEGKQFSRPPQLAKLSYWGDLADAPAGVRKVGTSEIDVNGKRVACEIRQVVTNQEGQRKQSVIHYCDTTFPFVLKRETSLSTIPNDPKPQTTSVEVVASNLPQMVLGVMRSVAYVKTTRNMPTGDSLTIEVQSPEVPGGVVSHAAHELDENRVLQRRSTLELIDYGVGSEAIEEASPSRKRWFHRSRARRGDEVHPRRN